MEKPRRAVKISVPSLAQFDDDEDETEQKVRKEPQKESGLFAVLPPPKGTPLSNKSFIPNVLTRKPRVPAKPKKPPPKKPVIVTNDSTESDDEDIMKDIPETFDEETWKKVCVPRKKQEKRKIIEVENYIAQTQQSVEIAPEPAKPYEGLDNEAFKQLVGSTKRRKENIKLIDINEEEVLPDKDLWLTKSLTDPNMAPKAEEEDPVNDTCKRKHHITYLAQQVFVVLFVHCNRSCGLFLQAKANEQELQSQWSQSKYNRRLTQSKYGF